MLSRRPLAWRLRDDRGAVAVIVGILAVVLFGIGALAVDLGNGFARKRGTQTDADFAALAGASALPDTTSARARALDYLTRNLPRSDVATTAPTLADMTDGNMSNGEICFPANAALDNDTTVCANNTSARIKVIVPQRTVNFGLANAVGYSSVKVTATATVQLGSPAALLAPFALPATCATGQQAIKDTSPGAVAPLQWNPNNPKVARAISSIALPPSGPSGPSVVVPAGVNTTLDIYATGISATNGVVLITTFPPQVLSPVVYIAASGSTPARLRVTIPAALSDGRYYLQIGEGKTWSAPDTTFFVDVGSGANTCNAATGDFGLINSPRKNITNGSVSQAVIENLAKGDDHGLSYWTTPPPKDTPCLSGNTLLVGAILDDNAFINNANCLDILNGNKVSAMTTGLITGGGGITGRLNTAKSPGCAGAGGVNPATKLGVSINNDVLSCFLTPGFGYKLAQLNGTNGYTKVDHILSSAIVKSPRFMFVPVLDTTVNQQNGWWPVIGYVGAFITDETPSFASVSTPATANNGVLTTNTQITEIDAYVFPLSALPANLANVGGTIPYLGFGPTIPVLVN